MKWYMQKQRKKYMVDELLSDDTKFREWADLVIQSIKRKARRK